MVVRKTLVLHKIFTDSTTVLDKINKLKLKILIKIIAKKDSASGA